MPRDTTLRPSGGSTHYYELPIGATELHHLIKHKEMPHGIGEAFSALYRLNDNGEYKRNLEKTIYYCQNALAYLEEHSVPTPVEPTDCLLGRKFRLVDNWSGIAGHTICDNVMLSNAFVSQSGEELEFSQTDSDGNVTIKGHDLTIPFNILKEVK